MRKVKTYWDHWTARARGTENSFGKRAHVHMRQVQEGRGKYIPAGARKNIRENAR